ncbi:30S ribosomal protein S16 [Candidatus Woesebacteria bacterium]|nr:MAG: 30S ribosomal protein S16 [Candidatus Woesebacteria bacterium]
MIKIRLARFGARNKPFYRVVVTDSKRKITGKPLEVLGFWNPKSQEKSIDKKKLDAWVKKGAQITATLKKLI